MKDKRNFLAIFFLLFCICLLPAEQIQAATPPVTITSCKLNSNGKKVTVKAKVVKSGTTTKKKLYLMALDAYASETGTLKNKPVASAKMKHGKVTFKISYKNAMLYQKFAVAYKTKGKYKILSDTRYITNPEVLATYTGKGPKAASKKGLQVEDYPESLELGTKHAVLNWTANMLLTDNPTHGIPYEYRGKTYYFNPEVITHNDAMVAAYTKEKVRVTAILLLPNDFTNVTAPMRYSGSNTANYSSFKTASKDGCRMFEAMVSFLAEHYSSPERLVSGWIVGNEVNSPSTWNYGGGKKLGGYLKNYTRTFRLCYNAVKSKNKHANVYISLDHNWNYDADGSKTDYFTTKSVLDSFYKRINAQGKVTFQIAYHCYPQNLPNPAFWNDSKADNSADAQFVTFKNLDVLTKYVKKNFGKDYKIMLSEQSFNSTQGEEVQAAAYAYAYYLCEANSMIEAFIYGRQFDHPVELADGCSWGLSDSAHNKRLIWDVFQFIDTKHSLKFTEPLVRYTNLTKWSKISGFKKSKYKKMPSILKDAKIAGAISASSSSVELYWSKVAAADGYEVYRDDQLIATITNASMLGYVDTGLVAGTTYRYKIRPFAYAPSKENIQTKTPVYGSYSKAKKVLVTAGQVSWNQTPSVVLGSHIVLFWNPQENVTGYEVLRSETVDGEYTTLTYTNTNSFDDTTAVSGKQYYYKVRAYVNVAGKDHFGEYSVPISAQALIQLDGYCSDGKVSLSWSAWSSAQKYQIYCAVEDDEFIHLKTLTELSYTTDRYKDTFHQWADFDDNVTYHFKVRAVFADGTKSPYSNTIKLTYAELYGSNPFAIPDVTESTEAPTEQIPNTESTGESDSSVEQTPTDQLPTDQTLNTDAADDSGEQTPDNGSTDASNEQIPDNGNTDSSNEQIPNTETTDGSSEQIPNTENTDSSDEQVPSTEATDNTTEQVPAEEIPNTEVLNDSTESLPNAEAAPAA